ncbi:YuzF family protein [Cytobacillus spongiae]|jgi:hypothetical protein|uniref:YuzF family protein n=1 Tax=Cytobacillus spongiae TaxID=2901381 RepID=UPI001F251D8C|nr:YuzF family protein [Cytobacillus spongiae]UII54492.1 YuzF family protein [Cytobacillus spongiae]
MPNFRDHQMYAQMMGGQQMAMPSSQPMYNFEPYVFQTLQTVMGKVLIVQTTKDTLRGKLLDVKPDHIVMHIGDEMFFVRTAQIVSIMPDK